MRPEMPDPRRVIASKEPSQPMVLHRFMNRPACCSRKKPGDRNRKVCCALGRVYFVLKRDAAICGVLVCERKSS